MYNFGKAISDDAINEWKPLITISVIELFIVIQAFLWFVIVTKNSYGFPKLLLYFIALFISVLNYFIFLHKNKWKNYLHKFKGISKRQIFLDGVIILLVVFLILAGMIYTFYQLSLLDWKKINSSKYYQ
jgi:hypothetical protein